ncbi:MAG: VanZ family protein [Clostridia bacterium]|nr:VanZ family protein [Clostridia bacterium]MDD4386481.1 VanZ family protein [Clostridia bacterium]
MSNELKGVNMKVKKYILYTLLFVWCLVIFYLSNQSSDISGSNSLNILSYIFSGLDTDILIGLNSVFREFMHSGMFFILGILAYVSFKYSYANTFVYSLLFCALYALSDEIHQLFVSGRAFEIIDLVLDFIGSLVGLGLVKFVERVLYND